MPLHEYGHAFVCEYYDETPTVTFSIQHNPETICSAVSDVWVRTYWAAGGISSGAVLLLSALVLRLTINKPYATWGVTTVGIVELFIATIETFRHYQYINGDFAFLPPVLLMGLVFITWLQIKNYNEQSP